MHFKNKRIMGMALGLILAASCMPINALAAPAVYIVGNSGDEVYEIQKKLNELGYLEANPTGYFGTATQKAVAAFQTEKGLKADGEAGPNTQQALIGKTYESKKGQTQTDEQATKAALVQNVQTKSSDDIILSSAPIVTPSPVYTDPNLMKLGSTGESVVKLQNRLKELGYFDNQAVTGYYYAVTANAVRSFQANNGLSVDGIAGAKTLEKLYSNSAVKAPSSGGTNPATSSKGQQTVELAKQHLGKPYVWGGNGPDSFDCSGFVHYVIKQQGFTGWRMSAYQMSNYASWKSVARKDLIPGDLMFFDTRSDGSVPIGHVGIYIGNNQMIHASSSAGKVVIGSINTDYYTRTFRSAKRVWN